MAASTIAAPSSPRARRGAGPRSALRVSEPNICTTYVSAPASSLMRGCWCVFAVTTPVGDARRSRKNCLLQSMKFTHRGCNGSYDPPSVNVPWRGEESHDDRRSSCRSAITMSCHTPSVLLVRRQEDEWPRVPTTMWFRLMGSGWHMWPRGSGTAEGRCTSAKRARKPKRSASPPGRRELAEPATGRSRKIPTPFAPASSATSTASTTAKPFRRLAGKCQVFIAPDDDHLRTRLTHAIEVAQVAVSIARPVGLNVALTAAAATGHDCGHGPAGHASEEALSPFLPGGYHHAVYGADVVLAPLNLCAETLDAVRNHSWNRPAPATPEGEVVAWADRIAYVLPRLRGRGRRRASWWPG